MNVNELVSKAQGGDQQAFAELYDGFAQKIFKYIRLKIQDRQEAEDILQEVFIKAYRGLGTLSMENLNFNAWLYKVCGNTINDFFRKKYRTPQISGMNEEFDAPSSYSLEKEAEIKWEYNEACEAFDQLPPLYKQVLELRFTEQLEINEV